MDRFDRIYRLHEVLSIRRIPVSLKQIMEQLECSKASTNRDYSRRVITWMLH
ncbi:hypothetical protein [Bathymodiolus platifrons methanotrophic gill symbiont]|uniref:hypothetical protein n=1 Tax=Bathymodiolus platifrons methanotrophic gill symbiont TaxID=113268 RepID=UPI00142D7C34|nr:hypothetical protein [Bathymodiolus platifrons methanotrophic gill symbiont]MCK5869881.1 hypothetical protein [Methyloprofundus sp.]